MVNTVTQKNLFLGQSKEGKMGSVGKTFGDFQAALTDAQNVSNRQSAYRLKLGEYIHPQLQSQGSAGSTPKAIFLFDFSV